MQRYLLVDDAFEEIEYAESGVKDDNFGSNTHPTSSVSLSPRKTQATCTKVLAAEQISTIDATPSSFNLRTNTNSMLLCPQGKMNR